MNLCITLLNFTLKEQLGAVYITAPIALWHDKERSSLVLLLLLTPTLIIYTLNQTVASDVGDSHPTLTAKQAHSGRHIAASSGIYAVAWCLLLNCVMHRVCICIWAMLTLLLLTVVGSPPIRTCDRKWTTMSRPTWAHRSGTRPSTRIRWGTDWDKVLFSKSRPKKKSQKFSPRRH